MPKTERPLDPRKLALKIANAAKSKKALKTVILDMREVSSFCDYFVIASGATSRQVHAIAEAIEESLDAAGIRPVSMPESTDESGWLVLDYRSVVAHIFTKELREFYALEKLWSDAKKVRITK
ncbi:MAG: ribosome silencing factor [Deltaproteobacteria bacterium]